MAGGVVGDLNRLGERDRDLVEAHRGEDLFEERGPVLGGEEVACFERRGDHGLAPVRLLAGRRREVPRVDGRFGEVGRQDGGTAALDPRQHHGSFERGVAAPGLRGSMGRGRPGVGPAVVGRVGFRRPRRGLRPAGCQLLESTSATTMPKKTDKEI